MSFYVNPEATFIPPHELKEPDTRLKGFNWREDERPTLADILNPSPEAEEEILQEEKSEEETSQIIPEDINE